MPAKQKHRVLIDTNLWVSFLISSNYSKLDTLLTQNEIVLIFNEELIEEFFGSSSTAQVQEVLFSD